jgi:hypothetical protein
MWTLFTLGIFGAMIALIVYEVVAETRGGHNKLTDRYHE